MPGTHVAMPDGRHVWEYAPRGETDLAALVKAAATQVLPDAVLTASEQRAVAAENARLVTTLTRHPGGASVQVHARIDESFTLVYDALVSRAGQASVLPTAVGAGAAIASIAPTVTAAPVAEPVADEPEADVVTDSLTARQLGALGRWSPDSGETIRDRLAAIVSMAMGYEPEDLPWEVPLVELGLDSMMAVRIKNRVEYDFDLPPIQLQAVRDANLYNIEKLIEYAIEHRDEVQDLHERQKTQTADEIAAEQAAMLAGATPLPRRAAGTRGARHQPGWRRSPSRNRRFRRHRPIRPVGVPARSRTSPARRRCSTRSRCRSAELGYPAAGCRRAGHVRDVGDRHRQVAGRHLQRAAQARRRRRDQAGPAAVGACRRHDHRRRRQGRRDHRGARHHRARIPGGRPDRRLRAHHPGQARRLHQAGGFRVPRRGRVDGGLRAAAQPPAGRTPRCTASSVSRAPSKSVRRNTFRSCASSAATGRSSWPAGRWAVRWPTPARSASSSRAATCRSSG